LPPKNYYDTIGVSKKSSGDEIKTAYRKLAKKYHPDVNPNDKAAEEKFKEVQEAYDVLGDETKRGQYDQMREGGFAGFGGPGGPRAGGFGGRPGGGAQTFSYEDLSGMGDLGDLFSSIFGGGQGDPFGRRGGGFGQGGGPARGPMKGRNAQAEIKIPFEQSISGGKTTIKVRRQESCDACAGSGTGSSSNVTTCQTCGGRGTVATSQGGFSISRPCPACLGRGQTGGRPCSKCGGQGTATRSRSISVKIPPGINNGAKIRVAGQGEPGVNGGPPGDLILTVRTSKHPTFRREGSDIHSDAPVNLAQAVLGATLKIETIDGLVNLKVPPGIQPGKRLRLKGKGVKKASGAGRGDHIVRINVEIPESLGESEKELFLKFADEAKLER
jgi:molecular chaperone DnaJ